MRSMADERIERFLIQLEHLSPGDLAKIALPLDDAHHRTHDRTRAVAAIRAAGRGDELDDLRPAIERYLDRTYSWGGLQLAFGMSDPTRTQGTMTDRVAVVAAVEDAFVATLAEDLVPPEITERLSESFELIQSFRRGGSKPGGLPWVPRWLLWLGAIGLGFVVVVPFLFTSAGAIIVGILTVTAIVVFGTLILRRRPPTF
jgi:hypothetical protein